MIFQKLLGDLNWVHSFLVISYSELANLYQTLKGDPALNSLRYLNPVTLKGLNIFLDSKFLSFQVYTWRVG